jgi:hypothetical protein
MTLGNGSAADPSLDHVEGNDGCAHADSDDTPVRDRTFDAARARQARTSRMGSSRVQMLLSAEADWPWNTVDPAGVTNQRGVHFP